MLILGKEAGNPSVFILELPPVTPCGTSMWKIRKDQIRYLKTVKMLLFVVILDHSIQHLIWLNVMVLSFKITVAATVGPFSFSKYF